MVETESWRNKCASNGGTPPMDTKVFKFLPFCAPPPRALVPGRARPGNKGRSRMLAGVFELQVHRGTAFHELEHMPRVVKSRIPSKGRPSHIRRFAGSRFPFPIHQSIGSGNNTGRSSGNTVPPGC